MTSRIIIAIAFLSALSAQAYAQPAIKKITYTDVLMDNGAKVRSAVARVEILFLKNGVVAMRFPDAQASGQGEAGEEGKHLGVNYLLKNRLSSFEKDEGKTFTTSEQGIAKYRAGSFI